MEGLSHRDVFFLCKTFFELRLPLSNIQTIIIIFFGLFNFHNDLNRPLGIKEEEAKRFERNLIKKKPDDSRDQIWTSSHEYSEILERHEERD